MFLDFWQKKRIKSNLAKSIAKRKGPDLPQPLKRVGILADGLETRSLQGLIGIIDALAAGTQIYFISFLDDGALAVEVVGNTFEKRAFNWRGRVVDKELTFFINQKFDVLINYYTSENLFLRYVSARSPAMFKVGFARDYLLPLNDLVIDTQPKETAVFGHELMNYLKILKRI